MVELAFDLPGLAGNPFDYRENDVQVSVQGPTGRIVRIPAFYDGGETWRARYTPTEPGKHAWGKITRNGDEITPAKPVQRDFEVSGAASSGFVRVSAQDRTRFALDDGSPYYPVGHNMAWGDVAAMVRDAGGAGLNWGRVWMTHWNHANLDWVMDAKNEPGRLDLGVARWWDNVIAEAGKADVRLQVVLQHHGQYSTRTNPNWSENPWNAKLGGFLSSPSDFFTSKRARDLTRAKYRYIVARWGYSPAVMSWELFNEVEWTDQASRGDGPIADWHREMAAFLREQDPNRHLVTSSSRLESAWAWDVMDYLQPHAYPSDPLPVFEAQDGRKVDKPIFFGEIGPGEAIENDDGTFLHRALWGSLVSGSAGAAQYWAWDVVAKRKLLPRFRPALEFLKLSGLTARKQATLAALTVDTPSRGVAHLAPGGGWSKAARMNFVVDPTGRARGYESFPSFLQGEAHREMTPYVEFQLDLPTPVGVTVGVRQVARAGAHLLAAVDGVQVSEKGFDQAARDQVVALSLKARVPAGKHTLRITNKGADWVVVSGIDIDPYGPSLSAIGRSARDFVACWVYAPTAAGAAGGGEILCAGLQPGKYAVTWWDTGNGKEIVTQEGDVSVKGPLTVQVPAFAGDAAFWALKKPGGGPVPSTPVRQRGKVRGQSRPGI